MSAEVVQADVDSLTTEIRQRSEILRRLPPHIRSISHKIILLRMLVFYFSFACQSRSLATRSGVWLSGVFIVGPFLLGGLGTVVTHMTTGFQALSIVIGILIAGLSPALLYGLLVYPATPIVMSKRDAAVTQLADQLKYRREAEAKKVELAEVNQSAERQLGELRKELDHLRKIQSREYKLEQLFNRNWRAMRSVEFELYLEEVFSALGYVVQTTATTGDQGVDLIVAKSGIRIAVQVKGYLDSVSNSAIQEAFAGQAHYRCDACAVVTNSRFTQSAVALAQSTRCVLVGESIFRDFVFGRFDLVAEIPRP